MGIASGISRMANALQNTWQNTRDKTNTRQNSQKKSLGGHQSLSPYDPKASRPYPMVLTKSQKQMPAEPMPFTVEPPQNWHQLPPRPIQRPDSNSDKTSFMQKIGSLNLARTNPHTDRFMKETQPVNLTLPKAPSYRPIDPNTQEIPMVLVKNPTTFEEKSPFAPSSPFAK
jgi:hypothetical protein